jgi:hypothetical protein
MIDIATLQYKRMHLLPRWLICIQEQTLVDQVRVNIWNNSGKELDIPQGFSFPVRVFGQPGYENLGSQARFHLASQLESEHILYLDDHSFAEPDLVEKALLYAKKYPKDVLGNTGKRMKPGENYYDAPGFFGKPESVVDYISTTTMIVPLEYVQLPILRAIPDPHWRVEDVYFAYLMAKMGIVCRRVPLPAKTPHDKYAACLTYRAYGMEAAYEELRKDWVLLCERGK